MAIVCGRIDDGVAIWIKFIAGGNVAWISIKELCDSLEPMAKALPLFHAFTGCDVMSSF